LGDVDALQNIDPNHLYIFRLAESTEWAALELGEVAALIASDELAADEPFIINSIIR